MNLTDRQLYYKRALVQIGITLLGLGRTAAALSRLAQAVKIVGTPEMIQIVNLSEVQADAEFALARAVATQSPRPSRTCARADPIGTT